ncbi:uncharacterized protein [Nicotiana tomentosiformis]|uniref:uncharacterized protein n=1 Tax=Nicotiana tomentosiformis TaxID=4098 RepID=UPI00388CE660
MSNLSKLEFVALDITGKNYLSWVLDTEIHLDAKDPLELWINLKDRYDHLKLTVLSKALYEWIHLRLQDFKTVSEYNSAISKQYRKKGFKKYSELITCLLVAEQKNTLLIKNHEVCPTGSTPFPEVNVVVAYDKSERKQNNYRDRGHGHRRGRGRGRNNYRHYGKNKQENNKGSQINPSKGPSNKYDSKAHLAYKDDDFGSLANITHLEAGDFFEDID